MTTYEQPFVHLRVHSEYSILDGLLRIKPFVERVAEFNMPAVAITDHVNLFGLVKFYRAALNVGVKPIIGADLVLQENQDQFIFTALCQNQQGYRHLTQLISKAYLQGQVNGMPTVCWQWITEACGGLIILSGGRNGDVGHALLSGKTTSAEHYVQRWLHYFPDRYYLELQRTNRMQEKEYLHAAIALAQRFNIPVVATNEVCFLQREDFEAHEARVCIHSGYILEDDRRPRLYSEQQYFRNTQEMRELFADIPEALENTIVIAKRCNLQLALGTPFLPRFPLPENVSLENYLTQKTYQDLNVRLAHTPNITEKRREQYRQRLQTELEVINTMGFAGYFLIVADFIQWAKKQQIPVGPGRGSGAGSLVAYALGITELDPIKHELLFERFLNPERISMPDFDIDFCMEQRDRVIDYVSDRYGRDAVSQIITFGTMAARAVVRDVGRVLGMPYGYVDKIAKLIPFELRMTLAKALEQEEKLAELYKKEEEVTTLIDLARKLEGLTRNAGKHAGGVVIAPTKLTDFAPLFCEPGSLYPVTQFDKDDVEAVGLVKFDFLGLRTLTIIDWALRAINAKRARQEKTLIDIDKIPLDDKKTYALLQDCATTAVFQLESRGMRDLMRRLRPDNFDDIMALVALFRPGPLQSGMVDDFINRKHGHAQVDYPHPDVESILRSTYGVILYQDQVMQIAQVLAGYSLGHADILRHAMGKKKPEEMIKQREAFLAGAARRGIDNQLAGYIFDLMEKFAGYGFNKSHSAAYALISYQTAWLKAHYPAEFMAAVLSSDMDNTDKVVGFINECRRMGLKVLPPNINVGHFMFTVNEESQIEYGLGAIKGVGFSAVEYLVAERKKNGPYVDLFDFCQRVDLHKVNRRAIEPLIRSGAMDVFAIERAILFASLEKAVRLAEQRHHNDAMGQADLFGSEIVTNSMAEEKCVSASAWDEAVRLQGEKETLGFYFSGHPLDAFKEEVKLLVNAPIGNLNAFLQKNVTIAGLITSIRTLSTRTGKRMAIVTLEDKSGRIEVTLFSHLFDEVREQLSEDQIFVVKGRVEYDDFTNGVRLVAEKIESFITLRSRLAKRIVIHVLNQQQIDGFLVELPDMVKPFCGGPCPIVIAYCGEKANAELQLGNRWRVWPDNKLLTQLTQFFGEQSVQVEYTNDITSSS